MQNSNTIGEEPDITAYAVRLRAMYAADPGLFARLFPNVDVIDGADDDSLLVGGALMAVSWPTGTVDQAAERLNRLLWGAA